MKRQNQTLDRLQLRLSSLFKRLLDPFRSADNHTIDHDSNETDHDVETVNNTPQVPAQPARVRRPVIRMRRLVVAVDASRQSIAALEAAANLAAGFKAQLRGVFVEDIELLRMADLPVSREVLYPCGTGCRVDADRLKRQLRAQASQARQALASTCEKRHVRWSFETVQGNVKSEVLAAARDADLLILGRTSRQLIHHVRMGSTAQAAIRSSPSSVLLTRTGQKIQSPVVTIFHDSDCGQRALTIAIHMAQRTGGHLTILLPGETGQKAQQYVRSQAAESIRRRRLVVRYRTLLDTGLATIQQAINSEVSGVALLCERTLPSEDIQTLIENLEYPIMVIR